MKKLIILFAILAATATAANAQKIAIKNNLLADATTSLNLGAEFGFAKHFSAELYASWNPFNFADNKKFLHVLVQPEFRYWTCESFNGWFFGVHGVGAQYNVGSIGFPLFPDTKNFRHEGTLWAAGATVGYQWIVGKRWNIEAALGGGYIEIKYKQFEPQKCGDELGSGKVKMWGLTKASLSLVFFFN